MDNEQYFFIVKTVGNLKLYYAGRDRWTAKVIGAARYPACMVYERIEQLREGEAEPVRQRQEA